MSDLPIDHARPFPSPKVETGIAGERVKAGQIVFLSPGDLKWYVENFGLLARYRMKQAIAITDCDAGEEIKLVEKVMGAKIVARPAVDWNPLVTPKDNWGEIKRDG